MCDEMRIPPIYESQATKAFRQQYLQTQNSLRQNGIDFQRHYAASVACSPSRASMYTGHYPSLHGVTQTTGAAKESVDPDVFWLDPSSVPTFGDYFRIAGYQTFWRGKWHASDAVMRIPGTHDQLISYDPTTGAPDVQRERRPHGAQQPLQCPESKSGADHTGAAPGAAVRPETIAAHQRTGSGSADLRTVRPPKAGPVPQPT